MKILLINLYSFVQRCFLSETLHTNVEEEMEMQIELWDTFGEITN